MAHFARKRNAVNGPPARRRRRYGIYGAVVALAGVASVLTGAISTTSADAGTTPWTAYVITTARQGPGGSIVSIPTDTNTPTATAATANPVAVAITPNAATAYVTEYYGPAGAVAAGGEQLIPPSPTQINATTDPSGIALSPDGATAWVIETTNVSDGVTELVPTATATGHARGTAIPLVGLNFASTLAISPDGKTAYVSDGTSVLPVTLPAGPVAPTAITLVPGTCDVPASPDAMAITPDGATLYEVSNCASTGLGRITAISTANSTILATVSLATDVAGGAAMSPDGQTLWVGDQGANTLVPLNTANNTLGTPIGLGTIPNAVAITPDGKAAYVTNDRCSVFVVDLTGSTLTKTVVLPGTTGCASGVAITPDQAPIAQFSVTAHTAGTATTFDGSSSSSPTGSIASYAWKFDDGATATGVAPTHVFATSGSHSATLTVTNTAGTSTTEVYTGQTMSRNGGPSAVNTRTFPVPAVPPATTTAPPTTTTTTRPTTTTTTRPTTTTSTSTTTRPPVTTTVPGLAPTITLDPPLGTSGTVTAVSGSGFPANTSITLQWAPGIGSTTVVSSPTGTIATSMLILPHDQLGPRNLVAPVYPTAIAPFLVVPGSVQPGGAPRHLLFRH